MQPDVEGPVVDVVGIDHGWIRKHFGWPLTGTEPITVRSISHSGGEMGSVHRVVCAGRSFVFKGPPERPSAWSSFAADDRLMEREVHCYQFLEGRGPSAPKVSPTCYWSALGPDGRGAVALEDLGPAAAPSGVMAAGLSRAEALAAIRCLALAHSASAAAGTDALSPPYPWPYSPVSEGLVAAVRLGLEDLPRVTAACWPEGLPGVAPERFVDVDVEAVLVRSHVGAHVLALCHGDAWASNILFVEGGGSAPPTALLIDWQFAMWGNPLSDVALLACSSLAPEARRAWEDELLRAYHATLSAHCALDYPLTACREDFRRAEPFAALVALATLEGYTSGMDEEERSRFAARATAAMEVVAASAP